MGCSSFDYLILIDNSSSAKDILFRHWYRWARCRWRDHAFMPIVHITIMNAFALRHKLSLKGLQPSDWLALAPSNEIASVWKASNGVPVCTYKLVARDGPRNEIEDSAVAKVSKEISNMTCLDPDQLWSHSRNPNWHNQRHSFSAVNQSRKVCDEREFCLSLLLCFHAHDLWMRPPRLAVLPDSTIETTTDDFSTVGIGLLLALLHSLPLTWAALMWACPIWLNRDSFDCTLVKMIGAMLNLRILHKN
jgi:hypothetical protein